jgi:predicted  nucleic acid-binding Zn-ribbon protein
MVTVRLHFASANPVGPVAAPGRGGGSPSGCRPARAVGLPVVVGLLLSLLGTGCAVERTNSVLQSHAHREAAAARAERDRLQRAAERYRLEATDYAEQLAHFRTESVARSAVLRAHQTELLAALQQLQHLEQDLAAAKARAVEVAAELQPLRALEQQRSGLTAKLAAVAAEIEKLEPQLAAQEADLAARQAALLPRLSALQQQLAAAQGVEAAVAAAFAAAAAAASVLLPAPPGGAAPGGAAPETKK